MTSNTNWWSSLTDIAESLLSQASSDLEHQHKQLVQQQQQIQQQQRLEDRMPWDRDFLGGVGVVGLEEEVMQKIVGLSMSPLNFTTRAPNADDVKSKWNFSLFVPVVMKLLEMDSNLNKLHAKESPKMDEEQFWFNYFCRIFYIRTTSGMEGEELKEEAKKIPMETILFLNSTSEISNNNNNNNNNNSLPLHKSVSDNQTTTTTTPTPLEDEDIDILLDDMLLDEKDKEVDGYLLPSGCNNNNNNDDDDDAELERQILEELEDDL